MKRSGFTMIELVFVIVILGILAAVAVPKLQGTRDDAKVSASATSIAQLASDIATYYTAKGTLSNTIGDMTNTKLTTTTALALGTTDGEYNFTLDGGTSNCIGLFIPNAGTSFELKASTTAADASATCTTLKTKLTASGVLKSYTVGGNGVTF